MIRLAEGEPLIGAARPLTRFKDEKNICATKNFQSISFSGVVCL